MLEIYMGCICKMKKPDNQAFSFYIVIPEGFKPTTF